MSINKEKLKFVLDAINVKNVFTSNGQKIKWVGVIGDEILSHTTNHFLSEKATQKWIDYVNNVEIPEEIIVDKQSPSLEEVVEIVKKKRKGKK